MTQWQHAVVLAVTGLTVWAAPAYAVVSPQVEPSSLASSPTAEPSSSPGASPLDVPSASPVPSVPPSPDPTSTSSPTASPAPSVSPPPSSGPPRRIPGRQLSETEFDQLWNEQATKFVQRNEGKAFRKTTGATRVFIRPSGAYSESHPSSDGWNTVKKCRPIEPPEVSRAVCFGRANDRSPWFRYYLSNPPRSGRSWAWQQIYRMNPTNASSLNQVNARTRTGPTYPTMFTRQRRADGSLELSTSAVYLVKGEPYGTMTVRTRFSASTVSVRYSFLIGARETRLTPLMTISAVRDRTILYPTTVANPIDYLN